MIEANNRTNNISKHSHAVANHYLIPIGGVKPKYSSKRKLKIAYNYYDKDEMSPENTDELRNALLIHATSTDNDLKWVRNEALKEKVLANRYLAQNEPKQALYHYSRALRLHRGCVGALEGRRRALMMLGRPALAARQPCLAGIKSRLNNINALKSINAMKSVEASLKHAVALAKQRSTAEKSVREATVQAFAEHARRTAEYDESVETSGDNSPVVLRTTTTFNCPNLGKIVVTKATTITLTARITTTSTTAPSQYQLSGSNMINEKSFNQRMALNDMMVSRAALTDVLATLNDFQC